MEELDLHYTKGDPDFGIASEGEFINDIEILIKRISEVKNTVKMLSINFQYGITEIPAVLSECKLLEKLNISHTGITEIPDFVFSLPNLADLSCCCTYLKEFPVNVFKAQKLERLHIRINKEWNIPDKIPPLPNLKILAIDLYTSLDMPVNLGVLNNLEQFLVATKYTEGDVPDLPSSFKNHPVLRDYSIFDPFHKYRKNFNLDNAVKILSTCSKFEYLNISGLDVGKGHQALSKLKNLKKLEMGHLVTEGNIFASISNLKNLEALHIWGSEFRITEIPDIFSGLSGLKAFSLAGNMVTSLPPSIYTLSNLKELSIGTTGIFSLDDKIGGMQNLEIIRIYDGLLSSLPETVFTLPNLKILNIEENIFTADEISKIKKKLSALAKDGQKIQFVCDKQGHRQMVKKLRAFNLQNAGNAAKVKPEVYINHCMNAINENPYSIKYVETSMLNDTNTYAKLCIAAVRKKVAALENIAPEALGKQLYYSVCMEAAKSQDIGRAFNFINSKFLPDSEYIQVCIEAALHNRHSDFIENFNAEEFQKRFNRDIYERVCWVAVLHNPKTASKKLK